MFVLNKLKPWKIYFSILFFVYFYIFLVTIFNTTPESSLSSTYQDLGAFNFLIYATIIGPIKEEFIFRGPLKIKNKKDIFLVYLSVFFFSNYFLDLLSSFLIAILTAFGFLFFISHYKQKEEQYQYGFKKLLNPVVIFSGLIFALFHIVNYIQPDFNLINILPLIIPQLILGHFFAYLRLKFDLTTAIIWHCIHNFIQFIQIYLLNEFDNKQSGSYMYIYILYVIILFCLEIYSLKSIFFDKNSK